MHHSESPHQCNQNSPLSSSTDRPFSIVHWKKERPGSMTETFTTPTSHLHACYYCHKTKDLRGTLAMLLHCPEYMQPIPGRTDGRFFASLPLHRKTWLGKLSLLQVLSQYCLSLVRTDAFFPVVLCLPEANNKEKTSAEPNQPSLLCPVQIQSRPVNSPRAHSRSAQTLPTCPNAS